MKKFTKVGLVCLMTFGSTSLMWAQEETIDQLKTALTAGSAKELVKYFSKNADIDFEGDKSTYSRTQAEEVMKDFFLENPPTSFKIVHKGASRAGSPYVIGEYSFKSGTFRVWIRLKEIDASFQVHALSFYKD